MQRRQEEVEEVDTRLTKRKHSPPHSDRPNLRSLASTHNADLQEIPIEASRRHRARIRAKRTAAKHARQGMKSHDEDLDQEGYGSDIEAIESNVEEVDGEGSESDSNAADEIAAFEEERARHSRQDWSYRVHTARGTTAPRNDDEETTRQLDDAVEEDTVEIEALRRSTRAQSATIRPDPGHLNRFSQVTAATRPGTRQAAKVAEYKKSEEKWQKEFERKQEIMLEQYQELQDTKLKLELLGKAFGPYDQQVAQIRRLANINKGGVLAAIATCPAAAAQPTRSAFKLHKNTAENFNKLPVYQPPSVSVRPRTLAQRTAAQPMIGHLDDQDVARGLFNSDANVEIRALQQQVTTLKEEVLQLETKVSGEEEQLEDLTTQLGGKNVDLGDFQHGNQGIKRQVAAQRVKNTTQGKEIKDLKKQLRQCGEEKQGLGEQLEPERARLQDLEQQIQRQETEMHGLRDQLSATQEEADGSQDMKDQFQQQATKIRDLQSQITTKEATLQNVFGKLDTVAETNNSAQVELAKLKAGSASNIKKIDDQAAQLSRLNAKWSSATALMKEHGVDDINGVRALLAQKRNKQRQTQQNNANKNDATGLMKEYRVEDIDGLRTVLVQRSAKLSQLRSDIASMNDEISTLTAEVTIKDNKLAEAETQASSRDIQIKKLESEVASLNKTNTGFIKQVEQLKKDFGAFSKRCEKCVSYLAQVMETLRSHGMGLPQPLEGTAFSGWHDEKTPAEAVALWRGDK